jgi:hypothetical protein
MTVPPASIILENEEAVTTKKYLARLPLSPHMRKVPRAYWR